MFASVFAAFGATTEQGSSTEVQSSESLIPATTVIVTTADSTTEAASSSGTASSDVPGQQDGDVEEDLAPWGAFPASSTTFLGRPQFVQTERKKEKLCFDGLINASEFTGHLLRRYNTEPDFAVEARKILALAFVKPEDLDRAVCELSESWEEVEHRGEDDGEDLITVFGFFYASCQAVLKNDPRTNNRAEAAHRRLQRELGADHPSIWKFIESLRKVQIGVDKSFEDMLIGRPAEQKRKKYRDADLRIRRLVDGYDEDNLLDFLRGIATNIGMS
ncbi:hypothetical protein QR680_008763 [Steinernema hermaphroditum]|uniref:Uncharacterized protein n=1 Tax=Steinernema hermaphroditum TaxID=289476 RepID=A0AA39M8H7_9BILA|nr:hypothetical protein QR680_008763 [Steinernema hermaphroditum]